MHSTITVVGLKPLTTNPADVGKRVKQAHSYKHGTITGTGSYGYRVMYDNGSMSPGQLFDSLSPYTRIAPLDGPTATAEEIAALEEKHVRYRAKQEAEEAEYERHVAELKGRFPWAVERDGKTDSGRRLSQNIKKFLKIKYPHTKFSVRIGRATVRVGWKFGPALTEVQHALRLFQNGHYDLSENLHRDDDTPYGRAVETVLGRADYVMCDRDCEEIFERVCRDVAAMFAQPFESVNDRRRDDPHSRFTLSNYAHFAFNRHAFPPTRCSPAL